MPLAIPSEVSSDLSLLVKESLAQMPPDRQAVFVDEYSRKKQNVGTMVLLAFFFPPLYFYRLNRVGLMVAFIVLGIGVVGFLWWPIEWFLARGRTLEFNERLARDIVRDVRLTM